MIVQLSRLSTRFPLQRLCQAQRWLMLRPVFARMRARADIDQLIRDATMPSTILRYHDHLLAEHMAGPKFNADLTWGRGYTAEALKRLEPHARAAKEAIKPTGRVG